MSITPITGKEAMTKWFAEQGLEYLTGATPINHDVERELETFYRKDKIVDLFRLRHPDFVEGVNRNIVAPMVIAEIDDTFGYGCFAAENIPVGTFVGEYGGFIRERGVGSPYAFGYLPKKFCLDATDAGNETRFLNHADWDWYKENGSEVTNVMTFSGFHRGLFRVTFHAFRDIWKGEELRISYGQGYFDSKGIKLIKKCFEWTGSRVKEASVE